MQGKTHIWRCLQKLYPNRIEIADSSNLTQDGWRGNKKWTDLLRSPIFRAGYHTILVLDEADKMRALLENAPHRTKLMREVSTVWMTESIFISTQAPSKIDDGGGLLPHDGQLFQPLDPYPGAVQGKHPPHPPEAAMFWLTF